MYTKHHCSVQLISVQVVLMNNRRKKTIENIIKPQIILFREIKTIYLYLIFEKE